MKLSSFRQLLFKKANDPELAKVVLSLSDDGIEYWLYETLEKMAAPRKPNAATEEFTRNIDNSQMQLVRDALGKYAAGFRKASAAGKKDIANKYAIHFYKWMNILHRANATPGHENKFWSEEDQPISPNPWHRTSPEQFVDSIKTKDLQGWQAGQKRGGKLDFSFLSRPPDVANATGEWLKDFNRTKYTHPTRGEEYHTGPYPFEHVKIGGQYIPVNDYAEMPIDRFDEHPIEDHPIASMAHISDGKAVGGQKEKQDANLTTYHRNYEDWKKKSREPDGSFRNKKIEARMDILMHPDHGSEPHFDAIHGPDVERLPASHVEDRLKEDTTKSWQKAKPETHIKAPETPSKAPETHAEESAHQSVPFDLLD